MNVHKKINFRKLEYRLKVHVPLFIFTTNISGKF